MFDVATKENKIGIITISPLILLGLLVTLASLISKSVSNWIWIVFVVIYWIILLGLIIFFSGISSLLTIFKKPDGKYYWNVLAVILSAGSIFYFFENIEYYKIIPYLVSGIIFSLINPIIEELYWRKVLLDSIKKYWLLQAVYFNILFSLIHYLALGQISSPNREIIIIPITFFAGLIWSLIFKKTGTTKYIIIGHFIMDICGFSALFIR